MTAPVQNNGQGKPDIWVDANVYVALSRERPKISQDGELGAEWHLVGLLDGSAGFTNTRAFEESTANAWGKGRVAKSRRNFTSTGGFTALENNDVTRYLMWPGSTRHVIVTPTPAHVWLAYEAVNDDGEAEIMITRVAAEVFAPEAGRTEEITGTAFEVEHFVDSRGGLFDRVTIDQETGGVRTIAPVMIEGLEDQEEVPLGLDGEPEGEPEDPEDP